MRSLPAYLTQLRQHFQRGYQPGQEVERWLRQAAACLPANGEGLPVKSQASFYDFQLFLAQQEWALAMQVLEELASGTRPSAAFWGLLAQVAERSECTLHAQRYSAYYKLS